MRDSCSSDSARVAPRHFILRLDLRDFRPTRPPDTVLMRHIRLLSDSCEVWRSGYSFCSGLLLQLERWFGVIGSVG